MRSILWETNLPLFLLQKPTLLLRANRTLLQVKMTTAKVVYYFSPGCPHCVNSKQVALDTLEAISKSIPSLHIDSVDVSKTKSEITSVPTMVFHAADGNNKHLNFRGIETAKLVKMLKEEVEGSASFGQGKAKKSKARSAKARARKPNFRSLEAFWSSISK